MGIKIRKTKLGDEKGMAKVIEEGLRSRNFSRIGSNRSFSREKLEKIRKEIKSDKSVFYFVALDNKKIIGSIGFHSKPRGRIRHRGEMGWTVHPDYQGRGISILLMRNILNFVKKKGYKKAEAQIAVDNKPSLRLAKRFGFKIEGRLKKALWLDNGKFIDAYIVGKIL